MEKKISVSKFMIIVLLLCVCQFFALFHTSGIIYKADFINLTVIIFSAIFIIIIGTQNKIKITYLGKYFWWMLLSTAVWIIEVLYSWYAYKAYGQSITQVVASSFGELAIILLLPLSILQENINSNDFLKNLIKVFGFIVALLSILQVFLYNYGIVFLDLANSSSRYGGLRLNISGHFLTIALIITLFDFIEIKSYKNLIFLVTDIFALFYTLKTRSEIIYVGLAILFVIILFLKNKTAKIILISIAVIAFVLIIINGFFVSFIEEIDSDSGVNMRYNTIEYYWQQFCEHPIFGMGFIKSNTASPHLQELLYGPLYFGRIRYYYRDDVGIIGIMNAKGILGLICYLSGMLLMLKQIIAIYKVNKRKYTWMLAVFFYISLCSINIVYVNYLRISTLVVVMTLINHYYISERKEAK